MKIIIDMEKKTIEVPKKIKEASETLGKKSVLECIDTNDYKVIVKSNTTKTRVLDKTNKKTIEDFMNKIKDSKKDLYEEYVNLRDKVVRITDTGKEVKTNFLDLKKWFYNKFPSENPFNK